MRYADASILNGKRICSLNEMNGEIYLGDSFLYIRVENGEMWLDDSPPEPDDSPLEFKTVINGGEKLRGMEIKHASITYLTEPKDPSAVRTSVLTLRDKRNTQFVIHPSKEKNTVHVH